MNPYRQPGREIIPAKTWGVTRWRKFFFRYLAYTFAYDLWNRKHERILERSAQRLKQYEEEAQQASEKELDDYLASLDLTGEEKQLWKVDFKNKLKFPLPSFTSSRTTTTIERTVTKNGVVTHHSKKVIK